MPLIKLLSRHEGVAAKAACLKSKAITVDALPLVRAAAVVGELARLNPAVLVLDLDRLPSNSREIALILRASKSGRHIPILLAGNEPAQDGLPQRYARLKSELPDIPYAAWPHAKEGLSRLLQQPRTAPHIVPPPRVYIVSLVQKLGILPGAGKTATRERQVALIGAPKGFVELLGDVPETVKLNWRISTTTHLALCFIRSLDDLAATLHLLTLRLPTASSAWVVYPKRTSTRQRDYNENDVRNTALGAGFVDYKICSIDGEWSAMKFAHRKLKSS